MLKFAVVTSTLVALALVTGCGPNAQQNQESAQVSPTDQTSPSPTQGSSTLGDLDQRFVTEAARGGLAEVQLGQLASQNASSDAVREFGQRMVTDHTQANNQLQQIASGKGITLPTDLGTENQAMLDRLSSLTGTEFDRQYMQHMLQDHNEDVSLFQQQSQQGEDADLRAFASQTLPVLQEHLQLAQTIGDDIGVSGSDSTTSPSPNSTTSPTNP